MRTYIDSFAGVTILCGDFNLPNIVELRVYDNIKLFAIDEYARLVVEISVLLPHIFDLLPELAIVRRSR